MDLDFWTLESYYFIINYAFFLVIPRRYVYQLGGILEQQRAGLGDCVMREGKGRTYKNIRKIFFVGAICAALLCGCSVIRIDIRKVRDLPYTVVDEYDVPEEMRQAIADQELAAAADDNAKAAAQSAVDEAQHRIDSLNAQINQLNAAQTSVQTQSAAAAPSSDGSAADNVPVDDGNAN